MRVPVAVDVLMTVYNGALFVGEAVASIQAQSLTNWRLIIVDDGSADETADILSKLAEVDPRIAVYTTPNRGVVEAANYGLSFCTAPLVARMDADDISHPDRLQRQAAYLQDNPDVLAISGRARHIDVRGRALGTFASFAAPELSDPRFVPAREPYLMHPFVTLRRQALVDVGGYRNLTVAEDADLFWRLQERGRLVNEEAIVGDYRLNPHSLSSHSVEAGRVMAAFSQLAGVSAERRRSGEKDLTFTRDFAESIRKGAESLEKTWQAASQPLTSQEKEHLAIAMAAKLLEMNDYRPYALEASDCVFINNAISEHLASLSDANRDRIRRAHVGSAARLAAQGYWSQARALNGSRFTTAFWIRYLLRLTVPPALHTRLRRTFGALLPR